jgi:hypothetical protein
MESKNLTIILMLFYCMFVPLKTGATIYQISSNESSKTTLNQHFVSKKKLSFKEKCVSWLYKKQLKKQFSSNDENVKKRVDGFAIISIVLIFSIAISPNVGISILLLVLSLISSLVSFIRISRKPKERGGTVFAVIGALISIFLLVLFKSLVT